MPTLLDTSQHLWVLQENKLIGIKGGGIVYDMRTPRGD